MKLACLLVLLLFAHCQQKGRQSLPSNTENEWALLDFVKVDSLNPILKPDTTQEFFCPINRKGIRWEERNILNPAAVVRGGKVYLIYRAQDQAMTSRLGLAISEDGLHFKKERWPVLYPANDSFKQYEWKGGVEDPRVVEREDGTYVLTYTAYDGKTARLCLATSTDLKTWKKQGLVLRDVKYKDLWSKSGAIVVTQQGNRMVASKVKGKYWMYFGDTNIFMASSDDLIHWEVATNEETKQLIAVLHPRPGYFDSRLVEPGPYALQRKEGILLIYNGSNAANYNDTTKPKFTYSAGQALYDPNNPYRLVKRTNSSFIYPDKPYEKEGEVNEVCFVEGLVYFNNRWLLYYGTADSRIAVAVKEEDNP
jgi:predicted GH43/DUF377 family glycosyl hydrolase